MVAAGWPLKARAEGPECSRCGRGPPGGRTGGRAQGRIALVKTLLEPSENPLESLSEKQNPGFSPISPVGEKRKKLHNCPKTYKSWKIQTHIYTEIQEMLTNMSCMVFTRFSPDFHQVFTRLSPGVHNVFHRFHIFSPGFHVGFHVGFHMAFYIGFRWGFREGDI